MDGRMKITEDNIDYNVARLIDKELGSPWEYAEQKDDADHTRLLMLGYIRGVLSLAEELKGVLKA